MEDMEEIRHSLTNEKLNELYRQLDNFIADSTWEEVQEHLPALNEVKTMIHQRMNENTKKSVEEEKSDEDRKNPWRSANTIFRTAKYAARSPDKSVACTFLLDATVIVI